MFYVTKFGYRVYYHIQISEDEGKLFTIILLWVKYHYKHLPMVVINLQYILQEKTKDFSKRFTLCMNI